MTARRTFIKMTLLGAAGLSINPLNAITSKTMRNKNKPLKLSLAQWSLHRALERGDIKAADFATIAKNTYGISAIEYVNQFYTEMATSEKFWSRLKSHADNQGVESLLIMVDDEGDLGNTEDKKRKIAVENHYKWLHAAKILGCHSIRVNAFGEGNKDKLRQPLIQGLGALAEYGAKENINVLIENHGLHTSNGEYMVGIIEEVDNTHLGTLPDFGNWCLNAKWGSTQGDKCNNIYDKYKGVADFLPFAKGVSAKSYAFDSDGNETSIDYQKMLKIVKDSGFKGHIGIEFEGENIGEDAGIRATKALIERIWKTLD